MTLTTSSSEYNIEINTGGVGLAVGLEVGLAIGDSGCAIMGLDVGLFVGLFDGSLLPNWNNL